MRRRGTVGSVYRCAKNSSAGPVNTSKSDVSTRVRDRVRRGTAGLSKCTRDRCYIDGDNGIQTTLLASKATAETCRSKPFRRATFVTSTRLISFVRKILPPTSKYKYSLAWNLFIRRIVAASRSRNSSTVRVRDLSFVRRRRNPSNPLSRLFVYSR